MAVTGEILYRMKANGAMVGSGTGISGINSLHIWEEYDIMLVIIVLCLSLIGDATTVEYLDVISFVPL